MKYLTGVIMAVALAAGTVPALAAPSAFILTVTDFTAKTYEVGVRQTGVVAHTFTLTDGHRSHAVSLKIESASVAIAGPNCNVTRTVSAQTTLTLEIRNGADGNCKMTGTGTMNGF